ncbi:hypothetical protein [Pelagibacterium halotolerans]|uniref:hypothetical protein n=1 Tax=Pelagibacterium halotolerans TaxID=531813 RepID=UPI00384F3CD6
MKPFFVAAVFAQLAASVAASDLVGTIMPPYPEGLTSGMGACVPDLAGTDVCAFSISTLNDSEGDVVAVVASRLSHRDPDGAPFWETIDVQKPPLLEDGQTWAMEFCYFDGAPDSGTIGVVTYRDAGGWIETGQTVWAIRLDVQANSLVTVSPERVACELPGS